MGTPPRRRNWLYRHRDVYPQNFITWLATCQFKAFVHRKLKKSRPGIGGFFKGLPSPHYAPDQEPFKPYRRNVTKHPFYGQRSPFQSQEVAFILPGKKKSLPPATTSGRGIHTETGWDKTLSFPGMSTFRQPNTLLGQEAFIFYEFIYKTRRKMETHVE